MPFHKDSVLQQSSHYWGNPAPVGHGGYDGPHFIQDPAEAWTFEIFFEDEPDDDEVRAVLDAVTEAIKRTAGSRWTAGVERRRR